MLIVKRISEKECVSITWVINNFIHLWQKNNEAIVSPMFIIYIPEETKWKLKLFLGGTSDEGCVTYFLYRDKECNGGENIELEYNLEILDSDESVLANCAKKNVFQIDSHNGSERYLFRSTLFVEESKYLTQGNLTLRCRMTQFVGKKVEIRQIYARTDIDVEKHCFLYPIKNFSNLTSNQKQSFAIESQSKKVSILIDFYANKDQIDEGEICFSIYSFDERTKFSVVKTFIVDSQKQNIDSGEFECWFRDEVFSLKFTKKQLMDSESLYLPNNTLTLNFELTNTLADERVEEVKVLTETWQKCIGQERLSNNSCALVADLASLHKDLSSCDMKLQTRTNIFPAHTLILSTRSPVFKAMFTTDMKEKVNGIIDVSDLDDETVRRFLLYLYTDQLDDLKSQDALQLYRVADKYAVLSLKEKCSVFLKYILNVENALEVLILSDLHQDKDLKSTAQKFILRNARIIFKSEEWKRLADTNSKLVIETMLRNWIDE